MNCAWQQASCSNLLRAPRFSVSAMLSRRNNPCHSIQSCKHRVVACRVLATNTTMEINQSHKAMCAPTLPCWCLQVGLTLILHIKPRQPEDERKTRRPAKMFSLPGKGYGRQIYAGSVTEVDTVSAPGQAWLRVALGSTDCMNILAHVLLALRTGNTNTLDPALETFDFSHLVALF